ncbi:MAG: ribosome biogenesis GTP-binding protein YihA/YsxC [Clostridiales bacterium]|nr:ribosome biogenesis GTP-binding protein YihA/YsxC [Clostridiales bacterium]
METKFAIKNASFLTSCALGSSFPAPRALEIAFVGKSNVGKSSLINKLCRNNKLARVSGAPGKTRLINYFDINGALYLVDLPGYGYAKASKAEQAQWDRLMGEYLSSGRVSHLFMLLDIRHPPTALDLAMYQYLLYYGIPFTLLATKSDKLTRSQRQLAANDNAKLLGAPPYALPVSGETGEGIAELVDRIGALLADAQERAKMDTAAYDSRRRG